MGKGGKRHPASRRFPGFPFRSGLTLSAKPIALSGPARVGSDPSELPRKDRLASVLEDAPANKPQRDSSSLVERDFLAPARVETSVKTDAIRATTESMSSTVKAQEGFQGALLPHLPFLRGSDSLFTVRTLPLLLASSPLPLVPLFLSGSLDALHQRILDLSFSLCLLAQQGVLRLLSLPLSFFLSLIVLSTVAPALALLLWRKRKTEKGDGEKAPSQVLEAEQSDAKEEDTMLAQRREDSLEASSSHRDSEASERPSAATRSDEVVKTTNGESSSGANGASEELTRCGSSLFYPARENFPDGKEGGEEGSESLSASSSSSSSSPYDSPSVVSEFELRGVLKLLNDEFRGEAGYEPPLPEPAILRNALGSGRSGSSRSHSRSCLEGLPTCASVPCSLSEASSPSPLSCSSSSPLSSSASCTHRRIALHSSPSSSSLSASHTPSSPTHSAPTSSSSDPTRQRLDSPQLRSSPSSTSSPSSFSPTPSSSPPWELIVDQRNEAVEYKAWRRDVKIHEPNLVPSLSQVSRVSDSNNPKSNKSEKHDKNSATRDSSSRLVTEYRSWTKFLSFPPSLVRDFYLDSDFLLKHWQGSMVSEYVSLSACPATGTEVARMVKKYHPLVSSREYVVAFRLWKLMGGKRTRREGSEGREKEEEEEEYVCYTKSADHPLAPSNRRGLHRVEVFSSAWRLKQSVDSPSSCELFSVVREDNGINRDMCRALFRRSIWGFMQNTVKHLRKYEQIRRERGGAGENGREGAMRWCPSKAIELAHEILPLDHAGLLSSSLLCLASPSPSLSSKVSGIHHNHSSSSSSSPCFPASSSLSLSSNHSGFRPSVVFSKLADFEEERENENHPCEGKCFHQGNKFCQGSTCTRDSRNTERKGSIPPSSSLPPPSSVLLFSHWLFKRGANLRLFLTEGVSLAFLPKHLRPTASGAFGMRLFRSSARSAGERREGEGEEEQRAGLGGGKGGRLGPWKKYWMRKWGAAVIEREFESRVLGGSGCVDEWGAGRGEEVELDGKNSGRGDVVTPQQPLQACGNNMSTSCSSNRHDRSRFLNAPRWLKVARQVVVVVGGFTLLATSSTPLGAKVLLAFVMKNAASASTSATAITHKKR